MEDRKIVELCFMRSEEGIKLLREKYEKICMKLSFNILKNNDEAEECLNDALYAFWNSVPPERPDKPGAYLLKIVRNLSISPYRKKHAQKRFSEFDLSLDELSESIASEGDVERKYEQKELTYAIEGFLDSISKENADIFVLRYWFGYSLKDISEKTGLKEKTVSVRLFRMRNSLMDYLRKKEMI